MTSWLWTTFLEVEHDEQCNLGMVKSAHKGRFHMKLLTHKHTQEHLVL